MTRNRALSSAPVRTTRELVMKAAKKLLVAVLSVLLAAGLGGRALATDAGEPEDSEGFSIEEMPEFGAADEIVFPPDEPAPTAEPTPEPAETADVTEPTQETKPAPEPTQEAKPTPDTLTEESAETDAPSAPEATPTPSEQNKIPVIWIAAGLTAVVIAALLLRKRKPADRGGE